MPENHLEIASRYFNYIAGRFPVMCASDEFQFLPRATAAAMHYDKLDDLSLKAICDCIFELKKFRSEFQQLAATEKNLENRIDLKLLMANVAGILIELETNRSWRHNPLLYLKIAFIGLDHSLTKPETVNGERTEWISARLNAIPRLLNQGIDNIDSIPETYYHASHAMLNDCKEYLIETGSLLSEIHSAGFDSALRSSLSALDAFGNFLSSTSPVPDEKTAPSSLATTLKEHFLSSLKLEDVFQVALDEWQNNLRELTKLQKQIDPVKSWQELYHSYVPASVEEMDTISLYQEESDRLRQFFSRNGFNKKLMCAPMAIVETPTYLRSVRSTASFAAAFTNDDKEISFFYITTHFHRDKNKGPDNQLKKRLHREYKFLTAHETYPGHQLLDTVRRKLKNPIRSQIESPFFYEGWATYAETLLAECGYVTSPIECLADYKRRLWRSARCQIDVGLHSGFLKYQDAVSLLKTNGFTHNEAGRQIDRFRLNPGYQLCYSVGCYEIKKLVKIYQPRFGQKQIHGLLLEGGQLPFHLIRERLDALEKNTEIKKST